MASLKKYEKKEKLFLRRYNFPNKFEKSFKKIVKCPIEICFKLLRLNGTLKLMNNDLQFRE